MKKLAISGIASAVLLGSSLLTVVAQAEEGWHAGVDLLFLTPTISDVGAQKIFNYHAPATVLSAEGNFSNELDFATRMIVGYEGEQGGGMQVRWFSFDNTLNYTAIEDHGSGAVAISGGTNLDVDAIDGELTQRGLFRTWEWLATAGARYARVSLREDLQNDIDWEQFADSVWSGSAGTQFEGAGPTVSVEGTRPIIWEGFSIFGRARTALLYGTSEQFRWYEGRFKNHDEFVQVWEIQMGFEHEHEFEAFDLVTGFFWEAQRWESDSQFLGDLAFHGFGAHVGIEY